MGTVYCLYYEYKEEKVKKKKKKNEWQKRKQIHLYKL